MGLGAKAPNEAPTLHSSMCTCTCTFLRVGINNQFSPLHMEYLVQMSGTQHLVCKYIICAKCPGLHTLIILHGSAGGAANWWADGLIALVETCPTPANLPRLGPWRGAMYSAVQTLEPCKSGSSRENGATDGLLRYRSIFLASHFYHRYLKILLIMYGY